MEHATAINFSEKFLDVVSSLDRKTESLLVQVADTSRRLSDIERKLEDVAQFRQKYLEWMEQYSRRFEEVRHFRTESRTQFEAVQCKLEDLDQDVRLLKAAVRDVDRRYETLQKKEPELAAASGQSSPEGSQVG